MSAHPSSAPNASTAQARVLVDELARCGVTDAVLSPGSRSAPFAFALDAEPRIRLHVHPDERSAAFVTLGLGLASRRPAVVVVTSGTAVANLHPAVLEADAAGVPLLLLTADRPPELRDTGADQTIRQPGIFGASVRWSADLGVAEDREDAVATWRATASRAYHAARGLGGSPGPVHLNAAFREPTVTDSEDGRMQAPAFVTSLDGRDRSAPWVRSMHVVRVLAHDDLVAFARRLVSHERGLILVGSGAEDAASADAVAALSRVTGWPVLAEGHTAARHRPGSLEAWPHLVEHDGFVRDHRPDLVLRLGRTTLSRGLDALLEGRTEEILIDAHGRWWDPRRAMSELVVADPVDTLQRVAAEIAVDTSSTWSDEWRAADTAVRVALDEHLSTGGGQVGARAVRAAVRVAAEDASILVASSLAIRHLDRHPERRPDVTWFANRGVAGIDGTVSTALGIALARAAEEQRRPTVAIVGDLAALHDTNAWLLVPDVETLDLTLVVVDDDGGAIFDLLPPSRFPAQRRLFATPHGRDLTRLAALHDLPLVSVSEDQLDQGFPRSAGGCRMIHVRIPAVEAVHAEAVRHVVDGVLRALRTP